MKNICELLATATLSLHLLWVVWVIAGTFFTRTRPLLAVVHIASLVWGVFIAIAPWPCPLTLLEQELQAKAGVTPYSGSFLIHYLDALVYPDLPDAVLTGFAVAICVFNLAVYAIRLRSYRLLTRADQTH